MPRALIERATAWAESWGGTSSVIAARLHPGKASMVELVVSPVRESRGKPVISTHKALRDLKERMGNRNEYAALQASWADWCAAHLAPALTRGIRSSPAPASDRLSGQTAPAALGQPVEALWTALTTSYLSPESVETLNGFLMLKAEILRHKAEGADYIPPKGVLSLENLAAFGRATGPDPWPYIEAIRSAAYQVTEVACGFGMGLDDSANDRYEAGHAWFPDRADRIHLAAVVAKCGAYCAQVEAEVKNVVFASDRKIDPCTRWPQGATQEILRHETNLGLLAQEAG
ncbi:hypothetical protein [Pontivivens insulae]|uniref:hypothetical protein n=1 Tax=Pontivivens insulae TaxID=1639689 RepID=UPI0011B20B15|nr:hypothetical protein [Pontivivens insulae]